MKTYLALCLVPLVFLPTRAAAQQVFHNTTLTMSAVPSSQAVQMPAFDPALGVLRTVQFGLAGWVSVTLSFENTNATSVQVPSYNVSIRIDGTTPVGLIFPAPNPAFEYAPLPPQTAITLPPFDGTLDFMGPSAVTLSFQHSSGTGVPSMTYDFVNDAVLPVWIGPAGAPGNVSFTIDTTDTTTGQLPQGLQVTHAVTADIFLDVRYTYSALPASICQASFTSSGCPCGNPGFGGAGCGNSALISGGRLSVAGSASIANDTLQLLGSNMTNSSALYFQGTSFTYVQAPFGDGLRCVFGSITRLGTKTNVSGASSYPVAGDASISVRGGVTAPGTRYYQTFYRDAGIYCTSATFNTTNGYAIAWGP